MKDIFKDRRILAGILVGIFVAIVAVIIVVVELQKPKLIDIDHGPGDEISEKSLVFYNRDFLKMTYNTKFSSIVLDAVEKVVFSDEEMEFSKDNSPAEDDSGVYYDATIDAANFTSYDPYTSAFSIIISDNREYLLTTKTDSLDKDFSYVYTAIMRKGGEKIMVFISGDNKNQASFVNFVKQKMGNKTVEITAVEDADEN